MNDPEKLVADAIAKLVKQQESGAASKMAAFEALLNEISAALSTVVDHLETADKQRQEPSAPATQADPAELASMFAKAIESGLKSVRIDVAAPKVDVAPQVAAPINITIPEPPAPVVHVTSAAGAVHHVEFKYGAGWMPESMTITRK